MAMIREASPTEQERRALKLVARGRVRVSLPASLPFIGGCVLALYLGDQESWWSLVALFGGIAISWVVHSMLLKRWWRWATAQEVDVEILCEAAEDAKLIWPQNSFLGRREAATWRRLSSRNPPAR